MEFVGKAINGYHLMEYVGFDGISTLYKAAAPKGEQFVVIKVFPSELGRNRQILEKMRASLQALSRMKHPGIVPVMKFSISEGYPYVVMPFIVAGSLEDRIAFGALTAINTEVVIRETASALSKAHSHGLVHGNLNPSQIFFDENGKVQVIGIGEESVLKVFSEGLQTVGEGSYDYRAPEAMNGGRVTPSSDQYSLALIALQLLSRLPVNEALHGLKYHLENGKGIRTRPNGQTIALPSKVMNVLARALSKNPSDRFPSIKAMFQALEAAIWKETPSEEMLSKGTPSSKIKPVQEKTGTEKRSSKRILVFAVAILIVLCLFAIEPALTLQGDLKLGSLLSNIGMMKSTEVGGDVSIKAAMTEPTKVATLVPSETGIVVGDIEILPTSGSPTEGTEQDEGETPVYSSTPPPPSSTSSPTPTKISSYATSTSVPTQTASKTSTATLPPTSTQPPPTMTITPIPPNRCSSYPGSDRYCTPTPQPTIPPSQCSRYHRSDDYCTPVPGATIPSDWCSEYSGSDYYCTRTPEPTIPPDQCSRDYHDDNFCTRTPEP
jgi:serine/threonine protein kinase